MDTTNNTTTDRNMLTDKELNYIKDFMSWELLAVKKCNETIQHCTDTDIKNVITQIAKQHMNHYDLLLSHLQ